VLRRDQNALSRIVRLVGADPKKTAVMRSRIAKNLEEMARFAEARPLREELIVLYQQRYGGESDEALAAEEILAVNLSKDEQWQEARNIWRRTFTLRLHKNGPQNERTMRDARWLDFVNHRLQSSQNLPPSETPHS
jgi:hypothetical protein